MCSVKPKVSEAGPMGNHYIPMATAVQSEQPHTVVHPSSNPGHSGHQASGNDCGDRCVAHFSDGEEEEGTSYLCPRRHRREAVDASTETDHFLRPADHQHHASHWFDAMSHPNQERAHDMALVVSALYQ